MHLDLPAGQCVHSFPTFLLLFLVLGDLRKGMTTSSGNERFRWNLQAKLVFRVHLDLLQVGKLRCLDDVVHEPVLERLLGRHEEITIGILDNLLECLQNGMVVARMIITVKL